MFVSGIYKILNSLNGKVYVGSAVNLHNRRKQHFQSLNCGNHYNNYLQSAWNKYGADVFSFEVIEYCIKEILLMREQFWINELQSFQKEFGYNIYAVAGSPFGYKHTDEVKAKLSEMAKNKTDYHRSILSKVHKGKIISEETKAKMSASHKGKPKTEEHKAAMKLAKQNISLETRQRMSKGQTGRVHSLETRIKMSEARKRKYAK